MRFQKSSLASISLISAALAFGQIAWADTPLPAGIYRVEPPLGNTDPPLPPDVRNFTIQIHRNAPAVRPDAVYALLARQTTESRTYPAWQVLLAPSAAAPKPSRTPDQGCTGYGFNDSGESDGICRNHAFKLNAGADGKSFTIDGYDQTQQLPPTYIEDKEPPSPQKIGAAALFGFNPNGHYIDSTEITHVQSRFTLQAPLDIQRILQLKRPVPLYPGRGATFPDEILDAGAQVGILHTDSQWMAVVRLKPDGSIVRGWLDRDTMDELRWIDQDATTGNFRFRVAFDAAGPEYDTERPAVAIEVRDASTGKRLQVFRDFYSESQEPSAKALELVDANFDGHPDLSIFGSSGGAGPNSSTNFFLFNPTTREFAYDAALSDLTQISIDPKSKTIFSASRGSCCSHYSSTWRYIQGRLTEVGNWSEEYTADGRWIEESTCKLSRGKMRCKFKRHRRKN
ncbi:XAC2610-related protein [Pseudacidovorax intermedius]|uniref:XAC2610-related protein n=1 Tax=Pseudacidovorax intermedius TaxID=433924 RepID=UPI00128F91B0|nr:hypothetical protein [Pseudacidovorax intermedius]